MFPSTTLKATDHGVYLFHVTSSLGVGKEMLRVLGGVDVLAELCN